MTNIQLFEKKRDAIRQIALEIEKIKALELSDGESKELKELEGSLYSLANLVLL